MEVAEANGQLQPFDAASRVRITGLAPDAALPPNAFIKAQVALVWPYSSSRRQVAFLLTDVNDLPSFSKGQIKVVFLNDIARKVAESKIGIGDTILLGLEGASFVGVQDVITTPGKRVNFDIQFGRRLRLEATTISNSPINIDATFCTPPTSPKLNGLAAVTPSVPVVPGTTTGQSIAFTPSRAYRAIAHTGSDSFRSSPLSNFVSGDDYSSARSRKRTKYGRFGGAWRMVSTDADEDGKDEDEDEDEGVAVSQTRESQSSPSPAVTVVNQTVVRQDQPDSIAVLEDAIQSPSQTFQETFFEAIAPPILTNDYEVPSTDMITSTVVVEATERNPSLEVSSSTMNLGSAQGVLSGLSEAAPTPRLTPIFSPGLPLISPLAQPNAYFEPMGDVSELDASSLRVGDDFEVPTADETDLVQHSQPLQNIPLSPNDQVLVPPTITNVEVPQELDMAASSRFPVYPDPVVDLDFLQEQIDLASAALEDPPPQSFVREDEDMYGPPLQSQIIGTPDAPVEISSDEGEEEEIDGDDKDEASAGARDADVTTVSEPDPIHQPSALAEEMPLHDVHEITSATETSLAVPTVDDAHQRAHEQVTALADQVGEENAIEAAMEIKGYLPPTSPISQLPAISSTLRLSHFFDGISESEPQSSTFVTLGPADVVDNDNILAKEVPTVLEPVSLETTEVQRGLPKDTIGKMSAAIQGQILTPGPIQATPMKPNLGVQSVQALPATPEDSQATKAEVSESFVVHTRPEAGNTSTPSVQPPGLRSSQRLLTKPRDSEGLFSEYFSPQSAKATPVSRHPKSAPKVLVPDQDVEMSSPSKPRATRPMKGVSRESERESSPLREFKGRATDLSYYPSLHSLVDHFNQLVDVIGVVTTDPVPIERAKSGPKDYHTTIQMTDRSLSHNNNKSVSAQLFRPRKSALPVVQKDDIVILRDFAVQTMAHQPTLLSTDSSAWAILRASNSGTRPPETICDGPPIEIGIKDTEQAAELQQWWLSEGRDGYSTTRSRHRTDILPASQDVDEASSQRDIPSSPPFSTIEVLPSSPPHPTHVGDSSPIRERFSAPNVAEEQRASDQDRHEPMSSKQLIRTKPDEDTPLPSSQNNPVDKAESTTTSNEQKPTPAKQPSRRKPPPPNVRTSIETELPPPPRRLTRSQSALSPTQPRHPSTAGSPTSPVSAITNASVRNQLSPESATTKRSTRSTRGASQQSAAAPVTSPRTTRSSHRRSATSESIVHELRDGTTYIDETTAPEEGDTGGERQGAESGAKHRRSSSTAVPSTPRPRRGLRSQTNVHELRDGTKYIDDIEGEMVALETVDEQAKQPGSSKTIAAADSANTQAQSDSANASEPEVDTISVTHDQTDNTNARKTIQKTDRTSKASGEEVSRNVPTRRGLRNQGPVHELRDGAKYTD